MCTHGRSPEGLLGGVNEYCSVAADCYWKSVQVGRSSRWGAEDLERGFSWDRSEVGGQYITDCRSEMSERALRSKLRVISPSPSHEQTT